MRKKIISAMLALCMAGSLLTGCGTSADAEKKSKVKTAGTLLP